MTITKDYSENTDDSSKDVSWSNKLTTPTRQWKSYQSLLKRRNGYRSVSQHYIQPLNSRITPTFKVTKTIKNSNYQMSQDKFNKVRDQLTSDTVTSEWIKDMIQRGKDILNKSRLKEQKIIQSRLRRYEEQQKIDNHLSNGSLLGNYHEINKTGSGGDSHIYNDKIYTIEINEKRDYEDPVIKNQLEEEKEEEEEKDVVKEENEQEQGTEEMMDIVDNEAKENSEPSIIILSSEDEQEQEQEESQQSNNEVKSDSEVVSYSSHYSDVNKEEEEGEDKLDSSNINEEYDNALFEEHENYNENVYGQTEEEYENESYEEEEEEEEEEDKAIEREDDNMEKLDDSDDNQYENMTVDFQKYMIPRNHASNKNNNPSLSTFLSNESNDPSKDNNINQNDTNIQVKAASNDVVGDEYYESNNEQVISEQSQEEYEVSSEEDDYSSSTKNVIDREVMENQEDNYDEEVVNDHSNSYLLADQELIQHESNVEEESKRVHMHNIIIDDSGTDDAHEQESLENNSLHGSNSIYDEQSISEEHVYDENLESDSSNSTQSLKQIAENAISQMYTKLEKQQFTENFDSDHELHVDVQSGSDYNEKDGQEFLHFDVQNIGIPEYKSDLDVSQQNQNVVLFENEHKETKQETSDHQEIKERQSEKYEEEIKDNEITPTIDMSTYHSNNNEFADNVSTEIEIPSTNANMKNTDQYEITISNSVYSNTSVDTDNRELFPSNATYISPFSDDPFAAVRIDETSKQKLQETLALLSKTDELEDKLESDSTNRDSANCSSKVGKKNNKVISNMNDENLNEDDFQTQKEFIRDSSYCDVINNEYKVTAENKILHNVSQADHKVKPVNLGQRNINSNKNNDSSHLLELEKKPIIPNDESFEHEAVIKSNSDKINSEVTVLQTEHNQVSSHEKTELSEVIKDDVGSDILSNIKELLDRKTKVASNPKDDKLEIIEKSLDPRVQLNKDEALQSTENNLLALTQPVEPPFEKNGTDCVPKNKTESVISKFGVTDRENVNMNLEFEDQNNMDRAISSEFYEAKNDVTLENKGNNIDVLSEVTNLNQPSVIDKIITSPIKAINALSVGVQKIGNIASRFVEVLDTGYSSDENESIIEIHSSSSVEEKYENEVNQKEVGVKNQYDTNATHIMIDIEQESIENREIRNMNDHKEDVKKNLSNARTVKSNANEGLIQNYNMVESNKSWTTHDIKSSLDVSALKKDKSNISPEEDNTREDNVDNVQTNDVVNSQDLLSNLSHEESQQTTTDEQTPELDGIINDNEEGEEITRRDVVTPSTQSSDVYAANKLFELAKEIDENTTAFTRNQNSKPDDGLADAKLGADGNNQIQTIKKDERSELEDYPINISLEDISRIETGSSSSIIASTTITAMPQESMEPIHKDIEILHDNDHAENKSMSELSQQLETSNELPSDPPSDDNGGNQDESKEGHEGDEHRTTVKEGETKSKKGEPNDITVHISISESEDQETENIPVQNRQNGEISDNQTERSESDVSVGVSNTNHSQNSDTEPKNTYSNLSEDNVVNPTSSPVALDEPKEESNIDKNKRKQKQKLSRHRKKRKLPITGSHMTTLVKSHMNEANKNNIKNDSNNNRYNRNSATDHHKHKKFKKNSFNHAMKKFK